MESDASYSTQNAWGPYKMYGPHTKYATLFTRELCMGGGHSCHDSVARRFCDVRSECTVQYCRRVSSKTQYNKVLGMWESRFRRVFFVVSTVSISSSLPYWTTRTQSWHTNTYTILDFGAFEELDWRQNVLRMRIPIRTILWRDEFHRRCKKF